MAKKKNNTPTNTVKGVLYSLVALLVFTATAGQIDLSKVDWSDPTTILDAFDDTPEQLVNYPQLDALPEYDGTNIVVTLNDNHTTFTEQELSLVNGPWQTFYPLDSLNRVGPANALLHKSMMPKEERGDISRVYPSGWKQKKLDDGKWLYNRSHLIAFRFTGENDNWQNLFTGTQQMNQKPMKEYEDKVANYLKETGNHVRYRVTPYFKVEELVPRGIQIEAHSVEDQELCFNIFIYNIQDGYSIDYATGNSRKI
ncbi:MAG TPA: DNA/RNA non-specific endonuclease [Enterococcus sp.]|nr:DNA/RNA non-specific endonuclease [Enterococcus sp.]HPR82104.1 DNA/RNA non-specific endonuclease [Enterococcus sp.]